MQIFEKIKFHLLEEGRDDMLKLHESLCLRMRQLKIANAIGRYSLPPATSIHIFDGIFSKSRGADKAI